MVRKIMNVVVALVFLVGIGLLAYPTFSDWWNAQHKSQVIASYEKKVENLTDKQYKKLWDGAVNYNKKLKTTNMNLSKSDLKYYNKTLDVTGTGIMGYVEIPKVNISLPIYHGDNASILQVAIGHIPGTSLPVGGNSTHCVISGHRGLPSAKLFTDIDQMKIGDTFMLQTLDNTLTYKVDQIKVVLPTNTKYLQIEQGKDLCTLMTCTPYGVNTHRLLVRGHRIPTLSTRVHRDLVKADPVIFDAIWAVIAFIVVIINVRRYRKYKKPKVSKSE